MRRLTSLEKVIFGYTNASILSKVTYFLFVFISMKFISKAELGIFTATIAIIPLVTIFQLGIANGLNRELPILFAKNNLKKTSQIIQTSFKFFFRLSILIFLICLITSIHNYTKNQDYFLICCFLTLYLPLFLFTKIYLPVFYKTNKDFEKLSKVYRYQSLIYIMLVPLTYYFQFYGFLLGLLLSSTFELSLLVHYSPANISMAYIKVKDRIPSNMWRTGFKIFLIGQINIIFESLIFYWSLKVFGVIEYANFTLALYFYRGFTLILSSISQVYYQKMNINYGNNLNIKTQYNIGFKNNLNGFFLLLILVIISNLMAVKLIPILLPEYANGIKSIILISVIPLFSYFNYQFNLFNTYRKFKPYAIILLIGFVLGITGFIYQIYVLEIKNVSVISFSLLLGYLSQTILGHLYLKSRTNESTDTVYKLF